MTAKRHGFPQRLARRGLTLVETMIVIAVMAIVAGAAAPGFAGFIDARRLDAAAVQLAADVQFTRSEAVSRNRPIRLSFKSTAAASCWIIHTGAAGHCTCGKEEPAVCNAGSVEIKTVAFGAADRVRIEANVASIVFDPLHGTSTPTGTLRLIDPRGRSIHHIVNVMGRIRSCSPGGAMAGWPVC